MDQCGEHQLKGTFIGANRFDLYCHRTGKGHGNCKVDLHRMEHRQEQSQPSENSGHAPKLWELSLQLTFECWVASAARVAKKNKNAVLDILST